MSDPQSQTPAPKAGLLSRILRWVRRAAMAAVVLIALGRLSMPLWIGPAVNSVASGRGLHVSWADMDLSLLGLSVDVNGVRVVPLTDETGAERDAAALRAARPLALLDDVGADLDVSALLTGTLRAHRVEVSGLEAWVHRDADGVWDLERYAGEATTEEVEGPADAEAPSSGGEPAEDAAIDFTSPVEIASVALQGVRVHLVDEAVSPTLDTALELDVLLRDVGDPDRPATVRVVARAEELLDVLRLEGEVEGREAKLVADLEGRADGIGVGRMAPYLAAVGIRPAVDKLHATFHLDASLLPASTGEDGPPALTGTATFGDLELRAGGETALALSTVELSLGPSTTRSIHVTRAGLDGLTAHAERLPDGTLRVAGLDLVGRAATAPEAAPAEAEDADIANGDAGPPMGLRVDVVEITGVEARFDDASVQPAAALVLDVGGSIRDVVLGAPEPRNMTIDLRAGVREGADLSLGGTVALGGGRTNAQLTFGAESLTLGALAPYLDGAGLESTLSDGRMTVGVGVEIVNDAASGGTTMTASVDGLSLEDDGRTLAGIERISLSGFELNRDGETRIASIGMEGARLPIDLYPGGGFSGLGLRSKGLPEGVVPKTIGVGDGQLAVEDIAFGGAASSASITGTVELLGLADSFALTGAVETRPGPLDVSASLEIDGQGLRYAGLYDLLVASGIQPRLQDGRLRLSARAQAKEIDGAIHAEAALEGFSLVDPSGTLVSLEGVAVTGVVAAPGDLSVERVAVTGARLPVERTAEGTILAAGLEFGGDVEPRQPGAPAQVAAPSKAEAPSDEAGTAQASGRLALGRFDLSDVEVQWRDAATSPEVSTRLAVAAGVEDLEVVDGELRPVHATVNLSVEGAMDSSSLDLRASSSAAGGEATVTVEVAGLRPGPLAPYLPPTLPVLYEDGRFRAQLAATATPIEAGGQRVEATIDGVDLRDGADGAPLLAFEHAELTAPRIDAEAGVYELAEIVVAGFAFDVERVSESRIEALGVAFDSSLAEASEPAPSAPSDGGQPGAAGSVPRGAPTDPEAPPTVTLGRLDVGVERLRYVDRTREGAAPLDLALALVTPGPQTLMGSDPEDLPATVIEVVGSATPLARELRLTLEAEPFSGDPGVKVNGLIGGIDGASLAEVDPKLAEAFDLSGLANGSVELGAELRLAMARRGPLDFDLARGFGATLSVAPLHLRPTPDATPTGFDRLDVEVRRVNPKTGDVQVASVDLSGIHARVEKRADGLHVAGLRIPPPPAAPEDAEATDEQPEVEPAVADAAESADEVETEEGGEISIARLTVSGVDFVMEDQTVEPALIVPITDAQLEVQRFTTRTLTEPRPFSFRLIVDAGEVEVPERSGADYLLAGVLSSVASMAVGDNDSFETELRRVWDLMEVSGRMSLGPEPRGRAEARLLGLELPAFRGPASAAGVEIGDGLIDTRLKLRFREDGGISINKKTVANYLSLSEPADGPISTYLQLPAPLDTVLFLLRNEEGAQELPIRLDVPPDGVGGGQIAALAAETLGLLVTDAVSSAPLRVLGPLADVAGALGLGAAELSADTVALRFESGAATLATAALLDAEGAPADDAMLTDLAKALRLDPDRRAVIQTTFGAGDLEIARRIANPPREVIEELVAARRARKVEIERERVLVEARAKAQLAAGSMDLVKESSERLRALEGDRRDIEKALDALFARLRPGAERRADMRTRNAAMALGRERLSRVRARLIELAGPAAAGRIDVRRPRYVEPKEDAPLPELGTVTITPR